MVTSGDLDKEALANEMAELIYERSQMARCDTEDLAWDLLELVLLNLVKSTRELR